MSVERNGENLAEEGFREVPIEIPFDEIRRGVEECGHDVEYMDFGHIRWIWIISSADCGYFAHATVGAHKREDGSENPFVFAAMVQDLSKLMGAQ